MARLTVSPVPSVWVMEPSVVRLEAVLASAMTSAVTWVALMLASGSTVLAALGAVLAPVAAPVALALPPELAAQLHAASARQLAPAATDASRTKARRLRNIRFSHQSVS